MATRNDEAGPGESGGTHNITDARLPEQKAALVKRDRHRRLTDNYPVAAHVFRLQAKPFLRSLVGSDGGHAETAHKKSGNTGQTHRGELSGNDVRCLN
jgi:hypothetical protein